jgi:hypothetical protein
LQERRFPLLLLTKYAADAGIAGAATLRRQ